MEVDIIVFGSIAQDFTVYMQKFPKPGETVYGDKFETCCGGKGANQAVQAALLDSKVAMVGKVGKDDFGSVCIKNFQSKGVITEYIEESNTSSTGSAFIFVRHEGENMIAIAQGANMELSASRAIELKSVIAKAKMIICQNEIQLEATIEALRIAKHLNVRTFLNFAPATEGFDRNILQHVDIFCVNEIEAECLSGRKISTTEEAENFAKEFLNYGPQMIIVTLGVKGAVTVTNQEAFLTKAPSVTVVDTTGAGDSFCGALAHYLVYRPDLSLRHQINMAVKIASVSVTKIGTQTSFPNRSQIISLIDEIC